MLGFAQVQMRLVAHLRGKVRSGEATERGLARVTGISQPHIHNVLKGKKLFSSEMSDKLLLGLNLDILDLLEPAEFAEKLTRLARKP
jgi:hypothetical protein